MGNFHFNNEIYKNMENRFKNNIVKRKRHVIENANRARIALQIQENENY